MVEVVGARMVPGTVDLHEPLPEPPVAPLRPERLERLIGMPYPPDRVSAILTRLGFEAVGDRWRVPTWRAGDVTREVDLIEEVARIDGLWKVPTLMPPHADAVGRLAGDVRLRRKVVDVLLGAGLSEAATVTFTDDELPDRLRLPSGDPRRDAVRVANPMSADQALLRMLIFPGLLVSASRNLDAGRDRVALFETGRVFLRGNGPLPDQPVRVSGILAGRDAGFFDIKGVAELLARSLHIDLPVADAAEPFFHPGRSARLGDSGLLGELHPLVAERFGIDQPVSLFEIDLDELQRRMPDVIVYRDMISFPPVRQDIAVILGSDVSAAQLVEVIRDAGGDLLISAEVFDVYEGPQVGEGRRSLAVHLVFQSPERTLTDDEADAVRDRIVQAVGERLGGELRS
jgi:phenylalanyl-tRNA synthetase beta chain